MKKIFTGILIFLVLLLAAAVFLPYIFKDRIIETIKTEANKNLYARLNFNNNISINIFKSFPDLHLGISDLSVISNDSIYDNDTIAYVQKTEVVIDLLKLYKDRDYVLKSLSLNEPFINLELTEDGKENWDVFIEQEEEESNPFALNFESIQVSDGRVVYNDKAYDVYVAAHQLQHRSSGTYSNENMKLASETEVTDLDMVIEGIPYFHNHLAEHKGSIAIDWIREVYNFDSSALLINGLPVDLDGYFAFIEDDIDFNISGKSASNDINEFLSLIPAIYTADYESMKSSGKGSLSFLFKGLYSDSSFPGYNLSILLENGTFRYPDLPLPAKDIFLDLKLDCPDGETDHQVLDISALHFSLDDEPFDLKLKVSDMYGDPLIDLQAVGVINFDKINKIIPLEDGVELKGKLLTSLKMEGRTTAISSAEMGRFKASGELSTEGLYIAGPDAGLPLSIEQAKLNVDNQSLEIEHFKGSLGKNDLAVFGTLNGFFAYLLGDGTLQGAMNLTSSRMNVNDFTSDDADTATGAFIALEVPSNLDLRFNANIGELTYGDLLISNFTGSASVKNSILSLEECNAGILGGNLSLSGRYETNAEKPKAILDLKYSDISAKRLAGQFNFTQKLIPLLKQVESQSSAALKFSADLHEDMSPDLSTLSMDGSLILERIKLSMFKSVKQMEQMLGTNQLSAKELKDFLVQFQVMDGNLLVKPLKIIADSIVLNLRGKSKLDGSLDYTGLLSLPASYIKNQQLFKEKIRLNTGYAEYVPTIGDFVDLDLAIGGTFTKPKVSLSVKNVIENYKTQLKQSVLGMVDAEKQKLEQEARDQIKTATDDARKAAEEKQQEIEEDLNKKKEETEAKLREEAERKKKALKEEAENKMKDIFKPK